MVETLFLLSERLCPSSTTLAINLSRSSRSLVTHRFFRLVFAPCFLLWPFFTPDHCPLLPLFPAVDSPYSSKGSALNSLRGCHPPWPPDQPLPGTQHHQDSEGKPQPSHSEPCPSPTQKRKRYEGWWGKALFHPQEA